MRVVVYVGVGVSVPVCVFVCVCVGLCESAVCALLPTLMKLIRLIFDDPLKGFFYLYHVMWNAYQRLNIEYLYMYKYSIYTIFFAIYTSSLVKLN